MTTIQDQLTASGEAAIEIRTLNVRVAPLTLAMLDQVPVEGIIDMAAGALQGDPLGRVVLPVGEQVLWMNGRDLRRCDIPEVSPRTPESADEIQLRAKVAAERQRLDAAVQSVRRATRFAELVAALDPDQRVLGGSGRARLAEIVGEKAAADLEVDADRGEVGPHELAKPKQAVEAALADELASLEGDAGELERMVAERASRDAEIAALVARLARLDQVFLL